MPMMIEVNSRSGGGFRVASAVLIPEKFSGSTGKILDIKPSGVEMKFASFKPPNVPCSGKKKSAVRRSCRFLLPAEIRTVK